MLSILEEAGATAYNPTTAQLRTARALTTLATAARGVAARPDVSLQADPLVIPSAGGNDDSPRPVIDPMAASSADDIDRNRPAPAAWSGSRPRQRAGDGYTIVMASSPWLGWALFAGKPPILAVLPGQSLHGATLVVTGPTAASGHKAAWPSQGQARHGDRGHPATHHQSCALLRRQLNENVKST